MRAYCGTIMIVAAATLSSCGGESAEDAHANAVRADSEMLSKTVDLLASDGEPLGTVKISSGGDGLTLRLSMKGLQAGTHGVHLHDIGKCIAPTFESAGGHWDLSGNKHGRENPDGPHLGDLSNLKVDEVGEGTSVWLIGGVTRSPGPRSIADADGTSLVVHAKADDYKTDPFGNSEEPVLCAVLAPPR